MNITYFVDNRACNCCMGHHTFFWWAIVLKSCMNTAHSFGGRLCGNVVSDITVSFVGRSCGKSVWNIKTFFRLISVWKCRMEHHILCWSVILFGNVIWNTDQYFHVPSCGNVI